MQQLPELRRIGREMIDLGRADVKHIEELSQVLHAAPINRECADELVTLHKRLPRANPAFERMFQRGVKNFVLADGAIDAAEAAWLRGVIFRDGVVSDEERKLLNELKGEATGVSPEFEALFAEAMKAPIERHTSG